MNLRSEHTPEKVADLIAEANGVSTNAVVANPRRYRNMIGQLADALEAMVKEMHARELHHFEEAHTPTDDERAFANALRADASRQRFAMRGRETDTSARLDRAANLIVRRTVQGEPTDAQVLAALEAYWGAQSTGFWFAGQIKSMRAALRAAAERGENGRER